MINVDEQWRPLPGYVRHYEVSDQGRVRSIDRTIDTTRGPIQRKGIVLRQSWVGIGYPGVSLHQDGKQRTCTVHSLVLAAFVGPRPEGMQVRHLNGDCKDNRLTNLVYGTAFENAADKVLHGTVRTRPFVATHCDKGHEYTEENTGRDERRRTRFCRICRRATDREGKRRRRARGIDPMDPRHGTPTGGINCGCKCGPCVSAKNRYVAERKELRKSA